MVDDQVSLIGIGYQNHTIQSFVAALEEAAVSRLIDVRLTPISRKPGFSKRALRDALSAHGIGYEHWGCLGNPRGNRSGFSGGSAELARARRAYEQRLDGREAQEAIKKLLLMASDEKVALMCFEADQQRCHRDVILRRLALEAGGLAAR